MKKSETRAQELIILIAKGRKDKKKTSHWVTEIVEIRNYQMAQENILRYAHNEKIKRDNADMKQHQDDRHREAQAHSDVFVHKVNYDTDKFLAQQMRPMTEEELAQKMARDAQGMQNALPTFSARQAQQQAMNHAVTNHMDEIASPTYRQRTTLWGRFIGWFTGWF